MRKSKFFRGLYVVVAAMILCCSCVMSVPHVFAASGGRTITLSMVRKAALANCTAYKRVLNKIDLQNMKYAAAVKSIQMKKKNMSTFRWTPLMSFQFPEKPTLANEYEWQYKPLQIRCVIRELEHQLVDEQLNCIETVSNLYVDIYICQEKIAYDEECLVVAEADLKRNQARLIIGQANRNDITKTEQSIARFRSDLTMQMRSFESAKSRLTQYIKLDITSGYTFENPLAEAEIPRSALDGLVQYTLENDQSFYETKMEKQLAYTSLTMTESLMQNQYGRNMNAVRPYIEAAKNGEEVDAYEFKQNYNRMLTQIDEPWTGDIRILFIKIKKEWFKGAVDGSRYVEDDPYALYTAALEYADACREEAGQRTELTNAVNDGFEALINARSAYLQGVTACEELQTEQKRSQEKNRLGTMTYEELSDVQEEYRKEQLDTLELLAEYSKMLYSFDRQTCGGITKYLNGEEITMNTNGGGNSYLAEELNGTAYYYIDSKIEDNIFVFGIYIPEDFSLEITSFELCVDGIVIGGRTDADKALAHLALNLDQVETVQVYLYNGEELVDICEIDADLNQAELEITGGYTMETEESAEKMVADYSYLYHKNSGTVTLTIEKKDTEAIFYYQIQDRNGKPIRGEELIPVSEAFTYLALLAGDFDELQIRFFDAAKEELYTGVFDQMMSAIVVRQ